MELSLDITVNNLVAQCVQGDMNSYRLLYNQYAKAMYNTALRIVNNTADAEDILQEAFTDAFGSLSTYRQQASFGAWLKRIVINKSINKVKREKKKWVEVDMESIGGYALEEEPGIDESEYVYRIESIKKGITQLADGYRTVLSLHLLEQYKHEEIAAMLGISQSTVRTQYIRAKKKLLEIIRENHAL